MKRGDWPRILALYEVLRRQADNPMVNLSHAIASAMVHGPSAGLERLTALEADTRLTSHYRLLAARAHLHEMLGGFVTAAEAYSAAARRTTSLPERNYLLRRYAECSEKMDHAR